MKKRMMLCGAAALMALSYALGACTVQWTRREDPAGAVQVQRVQAADPMEEFRAERQQLRQMQLSQLNEIVYGESAEPELANEAQRRQMELMTWAEQEQTLEGVLRVRGFDDVLATVHTDSVNIMVRAESVTRQQAAVILELVARETGISGGNVKIIPIN